MIPLLTAACIHTPTPSTPTSAAFEWTVTLADGDGLDDGAVGIDADTLTVAIRNSRTNFPSIVEWSYGYAMTRLGPDLGWYGEDCDGLVTQNHDICHEMDPDSTLVLTRVGTPDAIVPGSTTLMAVDFPVRDTPGITSVLYGYDADHTTLECFVQGQDVRHYASTGCSVYTP